MCACVYACVHVLVLESKRKARPCAGIESMGRVWKDPKRGLRLSCADLSLSITTVVVGLALVVPVTTARCHSAITIQKLLENKGLLLTEPGNYTAYTWGHTARSWVARESTPHRPGVLPLLGLEVGA